MSSYSKAQEYRLVEYLSKHKDVEVIKYYGSREKNAGDCLARIGRQQVRIDHKSTEKESKMVIQKEWLPKLTGITMRRADDEGSAMPLITLTSKGHRVIWAMCYYSAVNIDCINGMVMKEWAKEKTINTGWFKDFGNEAGFMDFNGFKGKIMKLDTFIKEIKNV